MGSTEAAVPWTPRQGLETAAVVISWFILNIMMASSTKWLFLYGQICKEENVALLGWEKSDPQCRAWKFPLSITVIHMVFSWCMCYMYIFFVKGGMKGNALTVRQQFEKIAPLAGCFALSVAMGNVSLKYIYPSFNQMLGSLSPLITVAMSVVFQGKRYNTWTWLSMPVICGGLIVCSAKEVNFDVTGAVFCAGATILRAAKSIMQGKLLTEKLDSVTLLFYMAPWAAGLLFCLAIVTEGVEPIVLLMQGFSGVARGAPYVLTLLFISGANACLLNITNFLVTSYTSPVTLQVLGNVKNCLSIAFSVFIFGNPLETEQALGVVVCLFGVWLYNQYGGTVKASKQKPQSLELSASAERIGGPDEGGSDERKASV